MRNVMVPLCEATREQVAALDCERRAIAEGYIERLALQPGLGHRLKRGLLAAKRVRAVRFDRGWHPESLLGGRRDPRARRGDQDPSDGPRYRVVYALREIAARDVRLVVVLAVGRVHRTPGEYAADGFDAYDAALEAVKQMERRAR